MNPRELLKHLANITIAGLFVWLAYIHYLMLIGD
jgi:hypothetical protein